MLEINNNLNKEKELTKEVSNMKIAAEQNSFLDSNLGGIINGAVDIGLKAILPDFIEEQIIEVKDVMVQEGFMAGVKSAVDKALEIGKGIGGILTGDFKSIGQVRDALNLGDLANNISSVIDNILKKAEEKNILNSNIVDVISTGKDFILGIMNKNIGDNFEAQIKSLEKIDNYIDNWNKYYEKQDLKNMENQYKYIQRELKKVMPLEEIINKARQVENLHNLIKNKGNFNISKYELEVANQLA
jgi:hypothetical protein